MCVCVGGGGCVVWGAGRDVSVCVGMHMWCVGRDRGRETQPGKGQQCVCVGGGGGGVGGGGAGRDVSVCVWAETEAERHTSQPGKGQRCVCVGGGGGAGRDGM